MNENRDNQMSENFRAMKNQRGIRVLSKNLRIDIEVQYFQRSLFGNIGLIRYLSFHAWLCMQRDCRQACMHTISMYVLKVNSALTMS